MNGTARDRLLAATADGLASVPRDATVLVAISGGPDSTALAYLVAEARSDLRLVLGHVRHGLRDDTADLAVVERHATWLGLPLEVRAVMVRPAGHGLAAAARDARYAALRAIAAEVGAAAIAVGHTADDQAETLLLRLARGTGVPGLAGMAVASGDLVRPLLGRRRGELQRFLVLEGLPFAEDPSNRDDGSRRARVRHDVLPALARVGPDPVAALARLADLAREDDAALTTSAAAVVASAAVRIGDVRAVADRDLAPHPVAVRRRVWRQLVAELRAGPPPTAEQVHALDALSHGRRLTLPGGIEASAAHGWRVVAVAAAPEVDPVEVAVPGVTTWGPAGVRLVVRTPEQSAPDGDPEPAGQIAFALSGVWSPRPPSRRSLLVPPGGDAARCHLTLADRGPWTLRTRRAGDRVRTRAGTATVAAVLADAGMPRAVRERWPVLVDATGTVVWVPGVAVDVVAHDAGRADPAVQLVLGPTGP